MAMLSHETQNHSEDKADGATKKVDFLTFLHSQEKLTIEEANSHATDIMMGGVETVRLSMKAAIIMHIHTHTHTRTHTHTHSHTHSHTLTHTHTHTRTHTHTHTLTHTHRCRGKPVMPIFIDLQKPKKTFFTIIVNGFQ